jgi:hypothetical protein
VLPVVPVPALEVGQHLVLLEVERVRVRAPAVVARVPGSFAGGAANATPAVTRTIAMALATTNSGLTIRMLPSFSAPTRIALEAPVVVSMCTPIGA